MIPYQPPETQGKCNKKPTRKIDPRRVVTAVAPTDSETQPFLAVRTPDMVAKAKIPGILTKIYALRLKAPIAAGTVVLENCDGEGTPVITCMDLD